jgi:hypothetical protein
MECQPMRNTRSIEFAGEFQEHLEHLKQITRQYTQKSMEAAMRAWICR